MDVQKIKYIFKPFQAICNVYILNLGEKYIWNIYIANGPPSGYAPDVHLNSKYVLWKSFQSRVDPTFAIWVQINAVLQRNLKKSILRRQTTIFILAL